MVDIPALKIEMNGSKLKDDAKKAADTFANRIESSAKNLVSKLGLEKFKPTDGKEGASSSTALGVAAGLAAGGVIKMLDLIASAVADIPIITAVMKVFKAVLGLLFIPLIPILKPFLLYMAAYAKAISPMLMDIGNIISDGFKLMGDFLKLVFDAITLNPNAVKQDISNITTDAGKLFDDSQKLITDYSTSITGFADDMWNIMTSETLDNSKRITKATEKMQLGTLSNFNGMSTSMIGTATGMANDACTAFSNAYDKMCSYLDTAKSYTENFVSNYYSNGEPMSGIDYGTAYYSGNLPETYVSDAIITPNGTIHTNPNDFIIATKNPSGMGGGQTVNINIDKPTLTGQSDIKLLVREIEMALYKNIKRYNSYA